MITKLLEELTIEQKKIMDSSGREVQAKPVASPKIFAINTDDDGNLLIEEGEKIIAENCPELADAYIIGEFRGAPVMKPPYYHYATVQYYKLSL